MVYFVYFRKDPEETFPINDLGIPNFEKKMLCFANVGDDVLLATNGLSTEGKVIAHIPFTCWATGYKK